MFYLNNTQMVGRATRDAELKDLGSSKVTTFRIVCNKRVKKRDGTYEEKATFVDCEAWGQRAEFASNYVKKGTAIYVRGELEQDEWKTKEGAQRQKLKIYVLEIRLVDRPKNDGATPEEKDSSKNEAAAAAASESGLPF